MSTNVVDCKVTLVTDAGPITITDQLVSVEVSDSMGQSPRGTVTLPLKRTTSAGSRVPYRDLIRPGDLALVEMFRWDGHEGGWETVLHGPIVDITERETLGPDRYEVGTTLEVASMAHILERDQVSWWLFLGEDQSYAKVINSIGADQLIRQPFRVAYEYTRRVAMHLSEYRKVGLGLPDLIHLEFSGLDANANYFQSVAMVEGPHLDVVRSFLDAPFHELIVGTKARLAGTLNDPADKPPGPGGAATTLTFRGAPYPFATPSGAGDVSEWQALPVTELEGAIQPVDDLTAGRTDASVRNWFSVMPAFEFIEELYVYALGAVVKNFAAIQDFGYAPLKTRTRMVINNHKTVPELEAFLHQLSYRLAGQWNRQDEMFAGGLSTPLNPAVRPGERIRFPSPWHGGVQLEAHVNARNLQWGPETGGRTRLSFERGLPAELYRDPSWFTKGLSKVRIKAETYADGARLHDRPGHGEQS